MELKDLCVIVVWYNPTKEYVRNLELYPSLGCMVVIIDNSERENTDLAHSVSSSNYYWMGGNKGIACALNKGCLLAKDAGFEFVLTIDQDTKFTAAPLRRLAQLASMLFRKPEAAIVAPGYGLQRVKGIVGRLSVISSGNIVRLNAWSSVGGFDEALFIDQVDHDFCFRLCRNGYTIYACGDVAMVHEVGRPQTRTLFGKSFSSTNHSADRRYYMTRNRLVLRRRYPEYSGPMWKKSLVEWICILIVERGRAAKFFAVAQGFFDYARRALGPRRKLVSWAVGQGKAKRE